MKNYNIKDLKLMNMAREEGVFACESEVSIEDKIAFVDSFQDGKLSYIIALAKKFEADKDHLKKKDYENYVKTVSLQAWLKKNDPRNAVWSWSECCGVIEFMGLRRNIHHINYDVRKHRWDFQNVSPTDFIDSCFHEQLECCLIAEKQYYSKTNVDQQLIRKVCKILDNYGYPENYCFNIGEDINVVTRSDYRTGEHRITLSDWSNHGNDRALTIEEIKALEAALTPVEEKYQQLLKAQEEMEEALAKASVNFASSLKGER